MVICACTYIFWNHRRCLLLIHQGDLVEGVVTPTSKTFHRGAQLHLSPGCSTSKTFHRGAHARSERCKRSIGVIPNVAILAQDRENKIHAMSSQSHQCLLLTIRNNGLLTIQDFAHLCSALGPHTHSSHTRRVLLERKLVARSRRSVLSRFFGEWKFEVIPPPLVDSDTSDDEPEQANSSDDESTNLLQYLVAAQCKNGRFGLLSIAFSLCD